MERVDLFCHHYSNLSRNKLKYELEKYNEVQSDIQQMLHHPNQPPNLYEPQTYEFIA